MIHVRCLLDGPPRPPSPSTGTIVPVPVSLGPGPRPGNQPGTTWQPARHDRATSRTGPEQESRPGPQERRVVRVRIPVAERRGALLTAAFTVIASRGLAAASTRAIVAEAGMSLASFHYAFDSREELLQ